MACPITLGFNPDQSGLQYPACGQSRLQSGAFGERGVADLSLIPEVCWREARRRAEAAQRRRNGKPHPFATLNQIVVASGKTRLSQPLRDLV